MSDGVRRAEPLLLIAVGGFAGATCRFLLDGAFPVGFPWGTLTVKSSGRSCSGSCCTRTVWWVR